MRSISVFTSKCGSTGVSVEALGGNVQLCCWQHGSMTGSLSLSSWQRIRLIFMVMLGKPVWTDQVILDTADVESLRRKLRSEARKAEAEMKSRENHPGLEALYDKVEEDQIRIEMEQEAEKAVASKKG